jgi:CopG family nickel-responsive transcriptional regulator
MRQHNADDQRQAGDEAGAQKRVSTYEHLTEGNTTRPRADPVHFGFMGEERAVRFTVSLPARLMRTLDRLRAGRRYGNRSEFVRDLLRGELVKEEWAAVPGETVGVLTLVYDHETHALADKLTDIQHHGFRSITASLHIHLDEHSCLEVIALRGSPRRIRAIANQLLSVKGVHYGQLVPATRGKRLT